MEYQKDYLRLDDVATIKLGRVKHTADAFVEADQASHAYALNCTAHNEGIYTLERCRPLAEGAISAGGHLVKGDIVKDLSETAKKESLFLDKTPSPLIYPLDSQAIIKVTDKKSFNPKYIAWLLNSEPVVEYIKKAKGGRRKVAAKMLGQVIVPMLSMDEQKQIATHCTKLITERLKNLAFSEMVGEIYEKIEIEC